MERAVTVRSEVQENGDIFLYYVDENGTPIENTDEMITTIVKDQFQQLQENYILEEIPLEQESVENYQDVQEIVQNTCQVEDTNEEQSPELTSFNEQWSDQEIRKLLIFYIDNKKAFINGSFTKRHLWTVACQMTLTGKNAALCQIQLHNLKKKYEYLQLEYIKHKTDPRGWVYYEQCHKAFHDLIDIAKVETNNKPHQNIGRQTYILVNSKSEENQADARYKKVKKTPDEKVKLMLEVVLQNKKMIGKKFGAQNPVWEKIAIQLGETANYIHKKFLNYKRHYICMLEKRNAGGVVDWPYMALFEEIFQDDFDFQRKYGLPKPSATPTHTSTPIVTHPHTSTKNATKLVPVSIATKVVAPVIDWNDTEKTVLVKYYYDCFDEFQDPTVPQSFLWTEVGRLLDKSSEDCKKKYRELRNHHLSQYIQREYNIQTRKPIAIMFDNIISQEVEAKFCDPAYQVITTDLKWKTEKTDELVQFFFDNIVLFKDPICHFVCWPAIAIKLDDTIKGCKDVWNDLTALYKIILDDKKEDPDMQIDWRYIDLFDKIFDYGLDTKLMEGYENNTQSQRTKQKTVVIGKPGKVDVGAEALLDVEAIDIDEDTENQMDPNAVKILEHYMKYKEKFCTQKKKNKLWDSLAEQIQMSSEGCAAKFKNLKHLYLAYIQKEIHNSEFPILWPYYTLCKKVFGYRAVRNKIKKTKHDISDKDEWAPKETKMLINFAGKNLFSIEANPYNATIWNKVSKDVGKSGTACREMFLKLKKAYRQVGTMMRDYPESKVSWKYFKLIKGIYDGVPEDMQVDTEDTSMDMNDDEEYECIVVIPEGQELSDLQNSIITKESQTHDKSMDRVKWTKKQKLALLSAYYDYLKANEGKLINTKVLWEELGRKLIRKPSACRKMYTQIKKYFATHNSDGGVNWKIWRSSCLDLLDKIQKSKPKFVRPPFTDQDVVLKEQASYSDVPVPLWSVEKALTYYLEHVEEFVNPKYDKRQAWIGLAKASSMRLSKAFKKINYLKQVYNSEKNEVDGKPFEFGDTLKEILEKEFICKIAIGDLTDPLSTNENTNAVIWTDHETTQLLMWYLENLEMFKNPKYNQNYLWLEVPRCLNKSPLACSRKMAEIRSQYSTMVKENPGALNDWQYYELCQKIYGTGKKGTEQ